MSGFFYLIPISLLLGTGGLAVFLWSLKAKQYEDLEGAASRILFEDDVPLGDAVSAEPNPHDRDE